MDCLNLELAYLNLVHKVGLWIYNHSYKLNFGCFLGWNVGNTWIAMLEPQQNYLLKMVAYT